MVVKMDSRCLTYASVLILGGGGVRVGASSQLSPLLHSRILFRSTTFIKHFPHNYLYAAANVSPSAPSYLFLTPSSKLVAARENLWKPNVARILVDVLGRLSGWCVEGWLYGWNEEEARPGRCVQ